MRLIVFIVLCLLLCACSGQKTKQQGEPVSKLAQMNTPVFWASLS